ncbi:hypothetical protein ACFWC5_31445 [Streptomyces sp. NPDC060085]|uniref:hypothetical protein n=1 Tax=Streptomyces sp. NPDC060085 TaxID=3347054 RepID=UPI0036521E5C
MIEYEVSDEAQSRARMTVASAATGVDDCRMLLNILGLMESVSQEDRQEKLPDKEQ